MASFYEISTQDEMDNFWVVFRVDEGKGLQVRPLYQHLVCPRCQSFDPLAVVEHGLDPELVVNHSKGAFTTNDNFLVIAHGARAVLESLAAPEFVFQPLPGDSRYAVVLPRQPVPPEGSGAALELEEPCPLCRRRLFGRWHPGRLVLPPNWVFGALLAPAHRSLWVKWIGTAAAVKALKASRAKGWLFEPLAAPAPAPPPAPPGVRVLAGLQWGAPVSRSHPTAAGWPMPGGMISRSSKR